MKLAELSKITKRPLASELTLLATVRACDRCKQPTMWARRQQYRHGFCADHALADGPGLGEAVGTVLSTFPTTRLSTWEPEIFEPDEYGRREVRVIIHGRWIGSRRPYWLGAITRPLDCGPCEKCHATVRRYGPNAYPYCKKCEQEK